MKLREIVLLEKASTEMTTMAGIISTFITSSNIGVTEMRANRGEKFAQTGLYQLRVKPDDKDADPAELLAALEKLLKSSAAKKLKIANVTLQELSPNSSKFSSVSIQCAGMDYDIVLAKGANKGENFEKDLMLKMSNMAIAGIDDQEALVAFEALNGVDPSITISNVQSVVPREGATKRGIDTPLKETGKIIADIIIKLKNGEKRYISVKNSTGKTVAGMGVAGAFTDDLKVNTNSIEWKTWFKPFNVDPDKIEAGLQAYIKGTDVKFDVNETPNQKIKHGSPAYRILERMWGIDYIYLRQMGKKFKAEIIDEDTLKNSLLKNLTVTRIAYPNKTSKQLSIYLESDAATYKIEARNPKGEVKPKDFKLILTKRK